MSLAFLGGFVVVMVVLVVRAVRRDRKLQQWERLTQFNPVKHDHEAMEALRTGVVRLRATGSSGVGERIRADAERNQRDREAMSAEAARMAQDLLDEAERQRRDAAFITSMYVSSPAPVEPTPAYEPAPVEHHTPSVDHSPTHHDSSSSFDHGSSSSFDHGSSGGHHSGGDW